MHKILKCASVIAAIACQNIFAETHAWVKPFYEYGRQTNQWSLLGYSASTTGIAVGMDEKVDAYNILGVGLSYAFTDTKAVNNGANGSDINTYLAFLYGTYDINRAADLDWRVTAGINHSNMLNNGYNGEQFSMRADYVTKYIYCGTYLFSHLLADYAYLQQQNLVPTLQSANTFTIGVGLELEKPFKCAQFGAKSEIHGFIYYDLASSNQNTTQAIIMGGPAIATTSKPGRCTGDFGASIEFKLTRALRLILDYDLQLKSGYFDNVVFLNFGYVF